jgi:hypothetical protein
LNSYSSAAASPFSASVVGEEGSRGQNVDEARSNVLPAPSLVSAPDPGLRRRTCAMNEISEYEYKENKVRITYIPQRGEFFVSIDNLLSGKFRTK